MTASMIKIDFYRFVSSISLALDLAEACSFSENSNRSVFEETLPGFNAGRHNFASHSKKTALIAMYIADKMNYTGSRLNKLFIASFLHDIGAVEAFEACHSNKSFIAEHSEFGSAIAAKLPVEKEIPLFIKYHHESYDGSGPNGLYGEDLPQEAQIIHLADTLELMHREDVPYRQQKDRLLEWVNAKKGMVFSPDIGSALLEAAAAERFWLDLENINTDQDILNRIHPKVYAYITLEKLNDIAEVFADIIDKKSRFTHEHSVGIACYAAKFARFYGFDEQKSIKFRIAALLHDLGKLSIPNSILDKPGKLTEEEFSIIKSHTYYTKLILGKINGMEDISEWASNHHETLRGTGYPERLPASRLDLEARILAVCDIYQALTEKRPYRSELSRDSALKIIDSAAGRGDIDCEVVKSLKELV